MPKDLLGDIPEPPAPTDKVVTRQYYCPECHKSLRRINGKKGPFWGCTGFPECKTSFFDKDGKPSKEPDERFRCPVCTRALIRAENTRGFYWYCTGYDKGCKTRLSDDNGMPAKAFRCTSCGQLLKKRSGKNGYFWGCTQFPECRHTWPDMNGEPDFNTRS
ncbi:MAG: topoisomerase DNA-binding C4 zinc finger domain-containing protein [Gammaproteobacteria bacterium]|nr:topoisomerase DNA-binding C4 zinc finger domain-containing protein [Gammaproteobacteria bacterium]MDP2140089.1 topoisomerase DNA-binding C4 zinc finger domain-containing protein [Gammaproteobacteria bacterium]MDP2347651.1 topoisomerase DNA-binding C4 zinc finger domain-containing protein [Gammaproteobacteria bacterium]